MINNLSVSLPKQWKHWCKINNLYTMGNRKNDRKKHSWFYLIGKGYVWRLNRLGMFQRGNKIKDFDRWALCEIYQERCPRTLAEFTSFVKRAVVSQSNNIGPGISLTRTINKQIEIDIFNRIFDPKNDHIFSSEAVIKAFSKV